MRWPRKFPKTRNIFIAIQLLIVMKLCRTEERTQSRRKRPEIAFSLLLFFRPEKHSGKTIFDFEKHQIAIECLSVDFAFAVESLLDDLIILCRRPPRRAGTNRVNK